MRLWLALLALILLGAPAAAEPAPEWIELMPIGAVVKLISTSATCSGVVIGPFELLTARHCLGAPLRTQDIFGTTRRVSSEAVLSDRDVALLRIDPGLAPFQIVAEVSNQIPHKGSLVFVAGYGCQNRLDFRPAVLRGWTDWAHDDFEISGWICHGDSGGPLLNDRGQIIGLNRATPTSGPNIMAYETPVDLEDVEDLRRVLE